MGGRGQPACGGRRFVLRADPETQLLSLELSQMRVKLVLSPLFGIWRKGETYVQAIPLRLLGERVPQKWARPKTKSDQEIGNQCSVPLLRKMVTVLLC